MLNIGICDDNNTICDNLENTIIDYLKDKDFSFNIEVFYSGEDLIKSINGGDKYDILFLDIQLKNINGITVAKKIRQDFEDEFMKIIYISSSKDYLEYLFQTSPTNFIYKPLTKEKVLHNLINCINKITSEQNVFFYKYNKIIIKEYFKDIIYFESCGRKVKIVTKNKEDYFYDKLQNVYDKVKKGSFLLTHNCYIVNYHYINKVTSNDIILFDKKIIPLSRSKKDEVLEKISSIMKEVGYVGK